MILYVMFVDPLQTPATHEFVECVAAIRCIFQMNDSCLGAEAAFLPGQNECSSLGSRGTDRIVQEVLGKVSFTCETYSICFLVRACMDQFELWQRGAWVRELCPSHS